MDLNTTYRLSRTFHTVAPPMMASKVNLLRTLVRDLRSATTQARFDPDPSHEEDHRNAIRDLAEQVARFADNIAELAREVQSQMNADDYGE